MEIVSKVVSCLKNRGIQVLFLLTLYLLTASYLPLIVHQEFYTISVFIKDLLIWMLPLVVGFFIAQAICSFQHQAPLFVISLIIFEGLSNLTGVWYAYTGGHIAVDFLPTLHLSSDQISFSPLWRLPLSPPSWWSADKGTLFGLLFGSLVAITKSTAGKNFIQNFSERASWILTNFFSRLIPLFILGFVARMYQTNMLQHLFLHYGAVLIWLLGFLSFYLCMLFFVGNGGEFKGLLQSMRNLMPAGGLALSSGCSLSTMPWTIEGTSKNLKNPSFANAVIPATTNIQQIGDCIANTFLCFLIYRHFNGYNPDFMTWMHFSVVFVLARFATAAIIGGAIFIMLPIYETYLGFNPEMIALILAFNVILDPIITSSNVVANGALCRIYEKVWLFLVRAVPPLRAPAP